MRGSVAPVLCTKLGLISIPKRAKKKLGRERNDIFENFSSSILWNSDERLRYKSLIEVIARLLSPLYW